MKTALENKAPIVALESTIISHGLPRPTNIEVATQVEAIVRENGATPATIAVIDGAIHVGLNESALQRIATDTNISKASIRDLPIVIAKKMSAATTVAATSHIAHSAGIAIFATGGLGGVHRGAQETWDESADLHSLANTPVMVVSAGAKSILDVAATLERLETLAIGVVGYKTTHFPGFYLTESGYSIEHQVNSADEIAAIIKARGGLKTDAHALIVANPVAKEMDRTHHDATLKSGLEGAAKNGIVGKAVTPFLLEHFHTASGGESLQVNIEIIKSNSALAADIAVAVHRA